MDRKHIFFVEDDLSLISGLTYAMEREGYAIAAARTEAEAWAMWCREKADYDLVVLDVALPDGSGFELCKKIRRESNVPMMFLTAADEETDVIMGLDMGADDYITKPFKLAIFLSRIRALLRRSENFSGEAEAELHSGDITVQLTKGEGYKNGEPLELTSNEYRLLCMFMEHPGIVLSPEQILGSLWDCNENYIDNKALTVYIRRLRMKVEDDPGNPAKIVTVRGMGYKWNAAEVK